MGDPWRNQEKAAITEATVRGTVLWAWIGMEMLQGADKRRSKK